MQVGGLLLSLALRGVMAMMESRPLGWEPALEFRQAAASPRSTSMFGGPNTECFAVNGSDIPDVDFDVGESYAGLLPIGRKSNTDQLFFWFFPTSRPEDPKEIVLWLSGGPGCASVGEMIQENGPFSWKPGTDRPVRNPWSWHHVTNVVWVDQPIGTGFSQGNVTARDTIESSRQFMGFWKNFVDTFGLQGYKVYIAGPSYSGQWTPYMASEMLNAEDAEYFDVAGIMVFDGVYAITNLHMDVPIMPFINKWKHIFSLNESTMAQMRTLTEDCGFNEYYERYLTFPPSGEQPWDVPGPVAPDGEWRSDCDDQLLLAEAQSAINPCWSPYNVLAHCPRIHDPIGLGEGRGSGWAPGPIYFQRADVQAAIHAPRTPDWEYCKRPVFVDNVNALFNPGPGSMPVLPGVIDRTANVILGNGNLDYIALTDGLLLAIQNLTFGGELGFQSPPEQPLYIPGREDSYDLQGPSGHLGTWHRERGLTYFETTVTGHFIGKDAPTVSLRALEVLLGRVSDFSSEDPFTVP